MNTMNNSFGPVISTYTRAEAIKDGTPIDLTGLPTEYGIKWPVAITVGAHADTIAWSETTDAAKPGGYTGQDETGRAWDVLTMARLALPKACELAQQDGTGSVAFSLVRVPPTGRGLRPTRANLQLHVGPGDDGAPVITILRPNED